MTLPHEEVLAVINTREFLYSLIDPKKTKRIPKNIRIRARQLLKHYPNKSDHKPCSKAKTMLSSLDMVSPSPAPEK